MIIFYADIAAYLNSDASTHAKHNSFHVLEVLAFWAASMALLNCFNLTKHDAILALFFKATKRILAASNKPLSNNRSPTRYRSTLLLP